MENQFFKNECGCANHVGDRRRRRCSCLIFARLKFQVESTAGVFFGPSLTYLSFITALCLILGTTAARWLSSEFFQFQPLSAENSIIFSASTGYRDSGTDQLCRSSGRRSRKEEARSLFSKLASYQCSPIFEHQSTFTL